MHRHVLFAVFFLLGAIGTLSFASVADAAGIDCTSNADVRAKCQQEYDQLQQEIAGWQKVLDETRTKKNTLKGDVTALTAQINQAEAQIKQKNIAIAKLGSQIAQKNRIISDLEARIARGRDSLASLVRQQNQADDLSLPEIAFSANEISNLFTDMDRVVSIQKGLHTTFAQIRGDKETTQNEKLALTDAQNNEVDARYVVQTKEQQISQNKKEKTQLLTITSNQESQYQKALSERQARAAAIRSALFNLRDTQGIEFGTALTYATEASQKTGVRPAIILAFLSQESDLGKNVGSCLVTDLSTGNGKGKNTGTPFKNVMKAPRDTVPFEVITKSLGLDWTTTPVSCPQSIGYGGAMGPSQFIPSTWQLYAARLKSTLGVAVPNPWGAKDAIFATALYITDLGASSGTYTAERNAACQYFSGRTCAAAGGVVASYGDSVMAKAATFQQNIDFLKDN
ncbi:MAG: hypothetical protein ABA06_00145 [Parcubacteria bacterium C7867-001]|nr:MAG: hypothetical protein ABA06_00145 [Parcubacteria bacterium C7867-001]